MIYKYATSKTVSDTAAVVRSMTITPGTAVEFVIAYGTETNGSFTERTRTHITLEWSELGASSQSKVTDLITSAYARLRKKGVIPDEAT